MKRRYPPRELLVGSWRLLYQNASIPGIGSLVLGPLLGMVIVRADVQSCRLHYGCDGDERERRTARDAACTTSGIYSKLDIVMAFAAGAFLQCLQWFVPVHMAWY